MYKYSAGDEKAENYAKIKDVPSGQVVGTLEGCWRKQINYKPKGSKVRLQRSRSPNLICCSLWFVSRVASRSLACSSTWTSSV